MEEDYNNTEEEDAAFIRAVESYFARLVNGLEEGDQAEEAPGVDQGRRENVETPFEIEFTVNQDTTTVLTRQNDYASEPVYIREEPNRYFRPNIIPVPASAFTEPVREQATSTPTEIPNSCKCPVCNQPVKDNINLHKNCPECGKQVVLRKNRKDGGDFVGCSGYPTCKWTMSIRKYLVWEGVKIEQEQERRKISL